MNGRRAPVRVLLTFLGVFALQQAASLLGGRVADALYVRALDPDNAYWWLSVHHLAQMLIALAAILLLSRALGLDFRIRPRMNAAGARMLGLFSAGMAAYAVVYYVVGRRFGLLLPWGYAINARNVLGTLGFQLLLSGPSEELLFRALPITLFMRALRCGGRKRDGLCVALAALLFAVAHINWYTDPFRLSFHWYQVGYAFALGALYGVAYIRRGSILYPMLMHSLSNVIVIGGGYLFDALA